MKKLALSFILISISMVSNAQAGCEIIDFSTSIEIKRNRLVEERSYIIQINNKDSDWITDISIPYDSEDKLDIIEASIINLNGETIRKLKKKEVVDRNNISRGTFYEDSWVKEFKLKWNQYPYRIKYSYRKSQNKFIYITHWYPVVNTSVNTRKASLKVTLDQNYDVTVIDSKELKHQLNKNGEKLTYYWEDKNRTRSSKESFSPPIRSLIPSVKIIPKQFNYDIEGSFETWQTYGQWHEQLNTGLDILTASEKQKINKLTEGISDKKEIIRILYQYLQDNTRYINVAIDIGGLKPYPASYVCKNKYGDCKALTNYMKALLKHAGINSYYTLIHAGDNPIRINREVPSQQFNHVILSVPLQHDTLWLENTTSHTPSNYIGTFTQDRYGLMINGKQTKLIKTKPLKQDDVLEENIYTFNMDITGKGDLEVSKKLMGDAFETYQYVRLELDESEQKKFIEKDLKINNSEIKTWTFSQKNRETASLSLNVNFNVDNQVRKIGDMIVLKPIGKLNLDLGKPANRKNSIRINYPINRNDSIIYNIPYTGQFKIELPENISIESEFGNYTEHYTKLNNQLIVSHNFNLHAGTYALNNYPELYKFTETIKKSIKKSVIILNKL